MKCVRNRLLLVTLTALLCVIGLGSVCGADDFTWNTIRDEWSYKEPAFSDGVYRMALHVNADAWAGYDRSVKRLRTAVAKNYAIETKITSIDSRCGVGSHFGIAIYKDQDNWILWGRLNGDRTTAQGVINGVGYELHNIYTVYPYLKITKEENSYTFSCSEDGEIWVSMPGAFLDVNGYMDGARYGIMAKNFEEYDDFGRTYNIQFDYFYETPLASTTD